MEPRALGWEQIGDCGSMRVVGLSLRPGQRVPVHRNALPVAVIVTRGRLRYGERADADSGPPPAEAGAAGPGELLLINPGERHAYWAEEETAAYMVFAGLPGVRARAWSLRRR
ncbi:MAG: AraC family ligand binding domain-containing protein [Candidatus Dormibacteraeota bacterium]|nr:AraC family ligand binding domain-containing protein [Candidatus Dormibacteraeota bacterium]